MRANPSILSLVLIVAFAFPAIAQQKADSPAPPTNYLLGQGDVIAVRVFRESDLDSQHRVSRDGTINFPLVGSVSFVGKSTTQAAAYLAALLDKDYLVRPQVSISVVTYAKRNFVVLGQVQKPGTFPIPEEESMDLLGAIAAAGGFTRLADQSNVILRRQAGGREESKTINVRDLIKGKGGTAIRILPNDTITVEERLF
jgi:polysaccharide export outer membrane protein